MKRLPAVLLTGTVVLAGTPGFHGSASWVDGNPFVLRPLDAPRLAALDPLEDMCGVDPFPKGEGGGEPEQGGEGEGKEDANEPETPGPRPDRIDPAGVSPRTDRTV